MDLNLKVNLLPALTYHRLHVNDSSIEESDINITRKEIALPEQIPAGITIQEQADPKEAEKIFLSVKEKSKQADEKIAELAKAAESETPGTHNGETYSRNAAQSVQTGMGVETDTLLDQLGVQTTVITAEEDRFIAEPLILQEKMENGEGAVSRQLIHAKKGSEITVIMEYSMQDTDPLACPSNPSGEKINCAASNACPASTAGGFHGVSTKLYAEEGATIHLVKVQMLGNGFLHFDDIGGVQEKDSQIDIIQLEMGAAKSWDGCHINLFGEGALFSNNVGYLCRGDQKLDMNYVAEQRGKKTTSNMIFRGVLMDKAEKTFRGTIDFKNGSSGSVGDEQEDTLLLSPDVVNRAIPVILCQEENVDGRHGATIGQLGDDVLFYMQSRGISEEAAKRIMVRARLKSIARLIPEGNLRNAAVQYIEKVL